MLAIDEHVLCSLVLIGVRLVEELFVAELVVSVFVIVFILAVREELLLRFSREIFVAVTRR